MNLACLIRAAIVPVAALTLLGGQAGVDAATAGGRPRREVQDPQLRLHAPDCRVVLQDNKSALLTVTLGGCTPTIKPITPSAPPSGTCVITSPAGHSTLAVGQMGVVWFATTGCNTTATDPFGSPVRWAVVA
jgi:hypothetical protein